MSPLLLLFACATWREPELVQQLDREVIALKRRNRLLEERLAACDPGEEMVGLLAQLTQVLAQTEARVERDGPRVAVTLPASLLFDSSGLEVREEASMVLDLLATALQLHPEAQVWIVGHTDDSLLTGALKKRHEDNWGLSLARAQSVQRVLVQRFGLDERRFTISGRGASQPIATNDTPEGRERNRRVEVVIGPPERYR